MTFKKHYSYQGDDGHTWTILEITKSDNYPIITVNEIGVEKTFTRDGEEYYTQVQGIILNDTPVMAVGYTYTDKAGKHVTVKTIRQDPSEYIYPVHTETRSYTLRGKYQIRASNKDIDWSITPIKGDTHKPSKPAEVQEDTQELGDTEIICTNVADVLRDLDRGITYYTKMNTEVHKDGNKFKFGKSALDVTKLQYVELFKTKQKITKVNTLSMNSSGAVVNWLVNNPDVALYPGNWRGDVSTEWVIFDSAQNKFRYGTHTLAEALDTWISRGTTDWYYYTEC